jgi:hypothetical protein
VTAANVVWFPLGELLVERGLLSRAQLELALAEQRRGGARLGELLVALGFVSETALTRTLLEQVGLTAPPAPAVSSEPHESWPEPVPEPALTVALAPEPEQRVAAVAPAVAAEADGGTPSSGDGRDARVRQLEELLSGFDERSRAIEEDVSRLLTTLRELRDERSV